MAKHRVVDWAGNEMYDGKRFDSFEDARGYIGEMAEKLYATGKEREEYAGEMYAQEVPEKLELTSEHLAFLLDLSGASTVDEWLLIENKELVQMVVAGRSKKDCLEFINANW